MMKIDRLEKNKIVTQLSSKGIWEILRDRGSFDDILKIAPDGFYSWLMRVKHSMETEYIFLENKSKMVYSRVKDISSRKDQALYIKDYPDVAAIVFNMIDGRDYSTSIWNMVKPSTFSNPFSNKGEV